MKPTWTALFVEDTAWALGLSNGQSASVHHLPFNKSSSSSAQNQEETLQAQITHAIALAHSGGAKLGPLVIGLPSHWCLAATVSVEGLGRRQRRQGLIYRLEERLPIDAEQFTADFIPPPPEFPELPPDVLKTLLQQSTPLRPSASPHNRIESNPCSKPSTPPA